MSEKLKWAGLAGGALLLGMLGASCAWVGLNVTRTLLDDHEKVQQIWSVEVQRAQQQQQAQRPPAEK